MSFGSPFIFLKIGMKGFVVMKKKDREKLSLAARMGAIVLALLILLGFILQAFVL